MNADQYTLTHPLNLVLQISPIISKFPKPSIFPSLLDISEIVANVTTAFLELLSLLNLETSRGDTYKYNNMCYKKKQTSMNVKRKKQLDLSWKIILKNFL